MDKPEFKDLEGQVWRINLTYKTIKMIERLTGVNLLKIFDPQSDDLYKLSSDYDALLTAIWISVEEQAKLINITDVNDFYERFDDSVIYKANNALTAALIFFFREEKRPILEEAHERMKSLDANVFKVLGSLSKTSGAELDKLESLLGNVNTGNSERPQTR